MKKLKRIFLFLIFSIFTLSFSNAKINVNAEIDYSVDGGLYEIDFNETIDLNNFSIKSLFIIFIRLFIIFISNSKIFH